jgi:hypothetical protein
MAPLSQSSRNTATSMKIQRHNGMGYRNGKMGSRNEPADVAALLDWKDQRRNT